MKNVMMNFRTLAMAAVVTLGFAMSIPSYANATGSDNPAVELKFVGNNVKNQLVFQLELNNAAADEYTINVSDKYGNVLYSGKVKGTNITKKLLFNKDEISDEPLRVKVKSRNSGVTETYEINRSTRVIEETVVNKLK